jgi:hypothetical protein
MFSLNALIGSLVITETEVQMRRPQTGMTR